MTSRQRVQARIKGITDMLDITGYGISAQAVTSDRELRRRPAESDMWTGKFMFFTPAEPGVITITLPGIDQHDLEPVDYIIDMLNACERLADVIRIALEVEGIELDGEDDDELE